MLLGFEHFNPLFPSTFCISSQSHSR